MLTVTLYGEANLLSSERVDDFIDAYGKGVGRIVITNINGEKNVDEIKKYAVFNKISNELKNLSVGRVSNK